MRRVLSMETDAARWLQEYRETCDMRVREIPWRKSREWGFDGSRFRHRSGGFFSVAGAGVSINGRRDARFDQPLIDQPEIGILGFLIRKAGAGTEILAQAKPEPGNVGLVQAAPTVQATKSNYTRLHHGKGTPFLEHFLGARDAAVLSDSLQSEQGTRFLSKFNRNMVAGLPYGSPVPEGPAYSWLPMEDFLPLLKNDFMVNTDARSVLACGPWRELSGEVGPFGRWRGKGGTGEALLRSYEAHEEECACSTEEISRRLQRLQDSAPFERTVLGLPELSGWEITGAGVESKSGAPPSVRHYEIESSDREVSRWSQPLAGSPGEGRAVLLCQERGGVLHLLFNCRAEIGFSRCFEYGPTVQDAGGGPFILPELAEKESGLERLLERSTVLLSNLQSDEGGRFYRSVSRYSVCLLDKDEAVELGRSLSWVALGQAEVLLKRSGIFSNEARSLISMLLAYL